MIFALWFVLAAHPTKVPKKLRITLDESFFGPYLGGGGQMLTPTGSVRSTLAQMNMKTKIVGDASLLSGPSLFPCALAGA